MSVTLIILHSLCAGCGATRAMHFLQLLSYKPERGYIKIVKTREFRLHFLLSLVFIVAFIFEQKIVPWAFTAIFVAYVTAVYLKKRKTVYKRTKRILRQTLVNQIIFGLLAVTWLPLCWAGCFVVPLVGLYLNLPLERAINRRYIRLAETKLRKSKVKTVVITGSYGKTGVKRYLYEILSRKFNVLMTPESYNTPLGIALTVNNSLTEKAEIFIVEAGAKNKGDIAEICEIVRPDVGIIVGIAPQHLQTFGNLDNVISTKFELADYVISRRSRPKNEEKANFLHKNASLLSEKADLPSKNLTSSLAKTDFQSGNSTSLGAKTRPQNAKTESFEGEADGRSLKDVFDEKNLSDLLEYDKNRRNARCNGDEYFCNGKIPLIYGANCEILRRKITERRINAFPVGAGGLMEIERKPDGEPPSFYRDLRLFNEGCECLVRLGGKTFTARTRLYSPAQIDSLSIAVGTAYLLGAGEEEIRTALPEIRPVKHRGEVLFNGNVFIIDDSYNCSTQGAECALKLTAGFSGKKFCVTQGVVEGGKSQTEINFRLGEKLGGICSGGVCLVGINSRAIFRGLKSRGYDENKIYFADSVEKATETLLPLTKKGDVLLYLNDLTDNFV